MFSSRAFRRLRLESPGDLLAAVPYLIGFHPTESLVLVGMESHEVRYSLRTDLSPVGDPDAAQQTAQYLVGLAERGIRDVVLIGYGSRFHVDPVITEALIAAEVSGLHLLDALRVSGDRYWSYLCEEPDCCPAEGVRFDPETSDVAVAATVAGLVALPDRDALVRQVDPVGGDEREAMRAATRRAERRLRVTLDSEDQAAARRLLVRRGMRLVEAGARRYADGDRLGDNDAAWLSLLLLLDGVIDAAWRATVDDPGAGHLRLWSDLTRRAEPDLCPPIATLMAYAAWQSGDGTLAGVAAQRALRDDPGYQPARLINELLLRGLTPDDLATALAQRGATEPSDGAGRPH